MQNFFTACLLVVVTTLTATSMGAEHIHQSGAPANTVSDCNCSPELANNMECMLGSAMQLQDSRVEPETIIYLDEKAFYDPRFIDISSVDEAATRNQAEITSVPASVGGLRGPIIIEF